jgi:hypothetical protein
VHHSTSSLYTLLDLANHYGILCHDGQAELPAAIPCVTLSVEATTFLHSEAKYSTCHLWEGIAKMKHASGEEGFKIRVDARQRDKMLTEGYVKL